MAWNQPGEDRKRPAPRGAPENSSLDEMLRRWQQRVQRLWRPGRGGGTAASALLLLIALVWLASGYFQVDSSERGVVQRFGRYVETVQPGRGWHWPWPIETLNKVNVSRFETMDAKTVMLTSEQGLMGIEWSVQYRISDPLQYLFQVHEPEMTLRQASDTVVRELVAGFTVPELLNGDARPRITNEARTRIQKLLDGYHVGIVATSVSLPDVQLPDAVIGAEHEAEKANEDRRRAIADAESYANDILPKAQASALHTQADAQVYAARTVGDAEGEAERFSEIANAYAQAPEVTRKRLYIDTIEGILSHAHKIIIDAKSGSGNMIYLPLDKLADAIRAAPLPAAPTPATAAGASVASPSAPQTGAAAERAGDGGDRGRERTEH